MSQRLRLENGETLVIRVTPVAEGLVVPIFSLVVVEGLVIWLATHWSQLHHYEAMVLFVVGLGPALVVATRSWRWRSNKVTLTSQRLVVEGGVLGRHSTQVYLGDIVATRAAQTFIERLRRRGVVTLETRAGTVTLGPVRHPAALRRLVDRSRRDLASPVARSWDEWFDDPYRDDDPRGPAR